LIDVISPIANATHILSSSQGSAAAARIFDGVLMGAPSLLAAFLFRKLEAWMDELNS
jgi:hypothetical protein